MPGDNQTPVAMSVCQICMAVHYTLLVKYIIHLSIQRCVFVFRYLQSAQCYVTPCICRLILRRTSSIGGNAVKPLHTDVIAVILALNPSVHGNDALYVQLVAKKSILTNKRLMLPPGKTKL